MHAAVEDVPDNVRRRFHLRLGHGYRVFTHLMLLLGVIHHAARQDLSEL